MLSFYYGIIFIAYFALLIMIFLIIMIMNVFRLKDIYNVNCITLWSIWIPGAIVRIMCINNMIIPTV